MKTIAAFFFILCAGVFFAGPLRAQAPAAQDGAQLLSADELDELLGPIALYPDSLIALILPASTVPSDIGLAAQFLAANVDPAQIPNQPWDDSVKALARYPDVLNWMNQNIDWTTQVGEAFVNQPADVMDSIQQLRAKAKAEGNLVNTPQQEVGVDDGGDITIDPTDPDNLYVPEYDPTLVYDSPYSDYGYPLIGFGPAYGVGPWLNYGFDWRRRGFYTGYWDHRGRGNFAGNAGGTRQWHPNPNRVRPAHVNRATIARPNPLPGATIPRGNKPALQTGHLTTSGLQSGNQRRDYTGWGGNRPGTQAQGAVVAPNQPPPQRAQGGVVFDAYGRGSMARDASLRGQADRQPVTAQPVIRPVTPQPQIVRPTVQQQIRPVAPPVRAPEPARTFQPPPAVVRAPEPPPRPAAPPPAAFQGMNSGAAAGGFGARGAQSRGR